MFKTISCFSIIALMAGGSAHAGNPSPAPAPQPVYVTPAPPPSVDWTGGYIGAEIGYGDIGTNAPGANGDGLIGGIIAGYDYDFGTWVAGLGIDYDVTDIDIGDEANLEHVLRLKARGGPKLGRGLAYLTGGYAHTSLEDRDDSGYFIGLGYEHRMTDNFSVGAELLYHEFSDFDGSGVDVDATTIQLRASYRF
ncbi:Opacity protein [Aliiroseovarius crassostreae]|uniref:Outer membrane protein beta-barrel domain-containing protein n=1 Tax=Aliiroseovarius crassostreae TaxID=154981 RepID=A0A0P7J5T2_9RHOB|nr:porin family protein [Aliiroseovarius crassostreae]KPN63448.1 hypothetical protein AKJ29_12395 [Aliiroseovarius crassostreae]SFU79740.1 Opacity protein [Aliiroseovarius crassostreae]